MPMKLMQTSGSTSSGPTDLHVEKFAEGLHYNEERFTN